MLDSSAPITRPVSNLRERPGSEKNSDKGHSNTGLAVRKS